MSLICPRCSAENSDRSVQCAYCGQPLEPEAGHAALAESDRRFPVWTILPWTLLAAASVLFMPRLIHSGSAEKPAVAAATQPAAAVPTSPLKSVSASAVFLPPLPAPLPVAPKGSGQNAHVPLSVTLVSAGSSRHVKVGVPVTISAYAALPAGQTATLAVSYSKDNGAKSLLSLTQGSLSSTAWTPVTPGRYRFIASALDSRKKSVFSRPIFIAADAPPLVKPVPAVKLPVGVAVKSAAAKRIAVKHRPAPQAYHVAAATFSYRPVAETLAGALRRRGFHAFVRASLPQQHPATYKVETGDYLSPADARSQVQLLQRDGYPASIFRTP